MRGRRGSYLGQNAAGDGSKIARGGRFPPPIMDDGERWLRHSSEYEK
jgi:hypothetical protein